MKPYRRRVYLIITRRVLETTQVLVFHHASKDLWCGVQTPGGSIENGETPLAAAIRECAEETGLHLQSLDLIAEDVHEAEEEVLERYFFRSSAAASTPDFWTHRVDSNGVDDGIDFELFWLDLPDLPGLSDHFRAYMHLLVAQP